MPTQNSVRIQGLLVSMMISLASGWSIPARQTAQKVAVFQRRTWSTRRPLIASARRATLQDRDYNTTSASPRKPSALPTKLKIKRSPASSYSDTRSKWTQHNTTNWREHPELNPTLTFPTWAVPLEHASIIQTLLSSDLTQTFLATRDEILQQCHPRPKIVQDGNNNTHKYILLHPEGKDQTVPTELEQLLQQHNVNSQGPELAFPIEYHQFPIWYILQKLLPQQAHPPPTAFETVGHVAHLNLKEHHLPYAILIGSVLLECLPNIETVLHKVGKVDGPFRTYDYEILAGRNDTTVQLLEHGIKLEFDLAKVYWCSRLAQERQIVLEKEIKRNQVIADAFCGVGALCLRAAQTKQCTILANDWNPNAVQYLEKNFATNKLKPYLAAVTNQDAYDFLMDLGFERLHSEDVDEKDPDCYESPLPALLADHVLLNFPLKAPSFLGALRWWSPPMSEHSARIHVYTFARADPESDRTAKDVAVDMIASALLPVMPSGEGEVDTGAYHRMQELNDDFGCQVVARDVRDVAPGKLVFCVSFTATPKLIRHMQGDFDE